MSPPAEPPLPIGAGRVVLVGFMGAGKSTVGPLLAHHLGYRFVDLDREVERRAGTTVSEIFDLRGEAAFRRLEAQAARDLDGASGVVVATGGGWMARPELRDRWPDAVRVWLRVRPETAVERLEGRLSSRPLLAASAASGLPGAGSGSPQAVARRLLASREGAYARAEIAVETDGQTPEEVAEAALEALRNLSPPSRLTVGAPAPARGLAGRRGGGLDPDPRREQTEDDGR